MLDVQDPLSTTKSLTFRQRGSCCESLTLHAPRTADHNCMHSILASCTLLKMFRHGLVILPQLSRAVWTVRTETCLLKDNGLQWYWWPQRCFQLLGVALNRCMYPEQQRESLSQWTLITKSSPEQQKRVWSRVDCKTSIGAEKTNQSRKWW